jgi:hypothetical protein
MLDATPPGTGFADALSLLASVVAGWLAVLYGACRLGVPDVSGTALLVSVGLSWFLVNAGFGVRWVISARRGRLPETWLLSEAFLSLAAPLVLTGLGAWFGGPAAIPAAGCGAVFFLVRCAQTLPAVRRQVPLALLAGSAALALILGSIVWGDGYLTPLFVPGLGLGLGHIDELFHASISNMIKAHGVPSTGLDGLVFCPYHFGTHWLFAHLAGLLQIPVIEFYQLGFPVLFLPWLLHAVGLATEAFLPRDGHPVPRQRFLLPFLLVLLAFGGFFPVDEAIHLKYLMNGITSESMCVAVAAFLLALAAGWPLYVRSLGCPGALPRGDAVAAAVAFPVLVVGLTVLKISVGGVLLAVACLLFVRTGLWRRSRLAWGSLALSCVAFLASTPLVFARGSNQDTQGITPLAYLRDSVPPDGWVLHLLLQYSWALAVVVLRLRQAGVTTAAELATAWRERKLLDVELLLLVALVGAVPGLLWRIGGGSAVYFFGIQRWLALPMLLAWAVALPRARPESTPPLSWTDRLRALPLAACLGWLFLGVALGTCALNTWYGYTPALLDHLLQRRGFYLPRDGKDEAAGMRVAVEEAFVAGRFGKAWQLAESGTAEDKKRTDPRREVVRLLRALDLLPPGDKRVTALFVPKRNEAYWKMLPDPRATPFLGPAVAGLPLLDGLPDPQPPVVFEGYGYGEYDLNQARAAVTDPEQERAQVVEKARRLGFGRVVVLDAGKEGQPRLLEWDLGTTRPLRGVLPETGSPASVP